MSLACPLLVPLLSPVVVLTLLRRNFLAFLPKTNSMASMLFDLPDPLGPTIDVKHLWNGPISLTPAYDLKFSTTCGGGGGCIEWSYGYIELLGVYCE